MKRKNIILLATMMAATMSSQAALTGDWKLYTSFDNYVEKVIDTPSATYLVALGQPWVADIGTLSKPYPFLYVYDKESDELRSCTRQNLLTENIVSSVYYNGTDKYLLIVYDNGNIDMIDSEGYSHNIPGLKTAVINGSRTVNDATFDPENGHIYLATDFGYVVVNDRKKEIADSRVFYKKLNSVGRVGDYLVLLADDGMYTAPVANRNLSFSDFTRVEGIESALYRLLPLDGSKALVHQPDNGAKTRYPYLLDLSSDKPVLSRLLNTDCKSATENRDGYLLSTADGLYQLSRDGGTVKVSFPSGLSNSKASSWDGREYWFGIPRQGLMSQKLDNGTWTVTRDVMRPYAPAVFMSSSMTYSPTYGLLTAIHRSDDFIFNSSRQEPLLISALKDGEWVEYGPAYTYPDRTRIMNECDGITFDPLNPNLLWAGSRFNGLVRLDLTKPGEYLQLSGPKDPNVGKPGFNEVIGECSSWDALCHFSQPQFDRAGNLYTVYAHNNKDPRYKGPLWVWTADDRKNGRIDKFVSIPVPGYTAGKSSQVLPLSSSLGKNMLVMFGGGWDDAVILHNHGGTPTDPSDDKTILLGDIYDQDGASVSKSRVYCTFEDEDTGYVWVGTFNGVFYFNPQLSAQNPSQVYRVKVSRNDGTNLADYLLDNITVYCIATDSKGRKWFGTSGGGIVVTSPDGREVLQEFTSDNSYLPSNTVFTMAFNPDRNSMMISTDAGLCEFMLAGTATGGELESVRAYPNPVRPDFLGWVTIDGLSEGSLVKIVDDSGNLVRELGRTDSGSVQWDLCNTDLKRVRSGVYYVAVSSSTGDKSYAKVTKILVVN